MRSDSKKWQRLDLNQRPRAYKCQSPLLLSLQTSCYYSFSSYPDEKFVLSIKLRHLLQRLAWGAEFGCRVVPIGGTDGYAYHEELVIRKPQHLTQDVRVEHR